MKLINLVLGQFGWYRKLKGGTWEKKKLVLTIGFKSEAEANGN